MPFQDTTEYEVWENPGRGSVVIQRYDPASRTGRMTEIVTGGRKFHVTPTERRLNQDMAISETVDIFRNGVLRPVRLLEDNEESQKLTTNPNHLTETEMIQLLKAPYKTFDKRLDEITNLGTVERLLELAKDEEVGATVRTVSKLQDRVISLNPAHVEDHVPVGIAGNDSTGSIRAVTPG